MRPRVVPGVVPTAAAYAFRPSGPMGRTGRCWKHRDDPFPVRVRSRHCLEAGDGTLRNVRVDPDAKPAVVCDGRRIGLGARVIPGWIAGGRHAIAVLAVLAGVLCFSSVASAALTVTSATDSTSGCSLRAVIADAAAHTAGGCGTIDGPPVTIIVPAGHYQLTLGELQVPANANFVLTGGDASHPDMTNIDATGHHSSRARGSVRRVGVLLGRRVHRRADGQWRGCDERGGGWRLRCRRRRDPQPRLADPPTRVGHRERHRPWWPGCRRRR